MEGCKPFHDAACSALIDGAVVDSQTGLHWSEDPIKLAKHLKRMEYGRALSNLQLIASQMNPDLTVQAILIRKEHIHQLNEFLRPFWKDHKLSKPSNPSLD
jgi:hypothetical protein